MSLAVIEAEIRRFLASTTAEVLCIKGRWGVGKTYSWRHFLRNAQESGSLGMERYAYVSLFGLNSLDDLRYALFQNTVSGEDIGKDPTATTFAELVKSKDTVRKLGPVAEWAGALFNRKSITDLMAKSAFLTVRNQLVCFDDLERASAGLGLREVLGITSLLKEERRCKVVLLLNDEEHDEKDEFERQLEKVADVTVRFDLTPAEAVSIALQGSSRAVELLRPRVIQLGINNIRVIKKMERLAVRLIEVLSAHDDKLVAEAVTTLALASWSVQQPKLAPPLSFLRKYNRLAIAMRSGREASDPETERYREQIADYPWRGANSLDHLVINGAEGGYFIDQAIADAANQLSTERKQHARDTDFVRAWEQLYHGSLAVEDDIFLDALYDSAIKEATAITPLNINGAIRMLRECGRNEQADEVISRYVEANASANPEFFNIKNHHFVEDDKLDAGLRDAFAARRASYVDTRDPLEVLRGVGERRGWTEADVLFLSKQSADDYERMFEALQGDDLRPSLEMIRALGRSHQEGSEAINIASLEGLRRIAAKSPLRARKLRGWGIDVPVEPDATEGLAEHDAHPVSESATAASAKDEKSSP